MNISIIGLFFPWYSVAVFVVATYLAFRNIKYTQHHLVSFIVLYLLCRVVFLVIFLTSLPAGLANEHLFIGGSLLVTALSFGLSIILPLSKLIHLDTYES